MKFVVDYFNDVALITSMIDSAKIKDIVDGLKRIRLNNGRIFVLGIGGSAANASHMVNDLRKLCGIEAYCPTDNVSEITARTNDDGFETIFSEYLKVSKFNNNDALFVLSVGGGNLEKNVSIGLINAMRMCLHNNVFGIVGKPDGYATLYPDVLIIPNVSSMHITPHAEELQAVVWHCIVSHPELQINNTKW